MVVRRLQIAHIFHFDVWFKHRSYVGYPQGIKNNEIPLDARIVAVADVFDALTSRRSYKEAWSNDEAIKMLLSIAGEKLDKECVESLIQQRPAIEEIQQRFAEA